MKKICIQLFHTIKSLFSKSKFFMILASANLVLAMVSGLYFSLNYAPLFKGNTAKNQVRAASPARIAVPGTKIDVPVIEGTVEKSIWQTSKSAATHWDRSARPQEGGNIVVYGHNTSNIFAGLKKVKIGDRIEVTTTSGETHEYVVQKTKRVKPTQIDVIAPTTQELLTLYTCIGVFDSERWIVQASLIPKPDLSFKLEN